ncbi:hypothetical protein C2845_PM07G15490 [Panicum miliaceum]|uniref:Uncharacterized protein n=1 Tax=Panicum miliaceum TaxID=4540 RepID=A0A3L6SIX5_PANMI|nr:hypothetical protein C2845_PM07G15490 [Panicum miliaceum]
MPEVLSMSPPLVVLHPNATPGNEDGGAEVERARRESRRREEADDYSSEREQSRFARHVVRATSSSSILFPLVCLIKQTKGQRHEVLPGGEKAHGGISFVRRDSHAMNRRRAPIDSSLTPVPRGTK